MLSTSNLNYNQGGFDSGFNTVNNPLFSGTGSSFSTSGINITPQPTGQVTNPFTGGATTIPTYNKQPVVKPQPPTVVKSSEIKPVPQLVIPQNTDRSAFNSYTAFTNGSVESANNELEELRKQNEELLNNRDDKEQSSTPSQQDIASRFFGLTKEAGTKGKYNEEAAKEFKLYESNEALNKVNNKILTLAHGYDERIKTLKTNPGGLFGGALDDEIRHLEEEKADKIASLNIEKAVAQGDVQTALANIEYKVKAKFDPIEQELAGLDKLYSMVQDNMTEEEKLVATANINARKEQAQTKNSAYAAVLKEAASNTAPVDVLDAIDRVYSDPNSTAADLWEAAGPYASASMNGLNAKQTQNFITISTKYQADDIVKNASKTEGAIAIADQVLADPGKAGNQLKILYTLVKNLDPDSAVREGELDLASKTQSYLGKFGTSLERINKGKLLSKAATIELANATKDLAQIWESVVRNRTQLYTSQANVAGIGSAWQEYINGANLLGSSGGQSSGDSIYEF